MAKLTSVQLILKILILLLCLEKVNENPRDFKILETEQTNTQYPAFITV